MKLGIVGLPNVGKSTLFNAITKAGAEAANYPFCTIEPNVGIVNVPDGRLKVLAEISSSQKITPATIEFVDIAGLVKGASRGEGLGNKFLSHIREVDAIVHVVRCFEDKNITHVDGNVDAIRDVETIALELIFADLESIEKRIERTKKAMKGGDKKYAIELSLFERIKEALEKGKPASSVELSAEEEIIMKEVSLLTMKPVIFAANVSEGELFEYEKNENYQSLAKYAKEQNCGILPVSAKIEEEISQLDDSEKAVFLADLGIKESGLDRLVKESYKLLGLISYLTTGPQETRAWTIKSGTKAPAAAGKIHSDFERGFIRAEVVSYDDLVECGSMSSAKEKGLVRLEGKDYVVADGDVILFRFNV